MEQLLKEWGLEELCGTFVENDIDLEALSLLNEESIKELIPKIGPRQKFIHKWKIYIADFIIEESTCSTSTSSNSTNNLSNVPPVFDANNDNICLETNEVFENYRSESILGFTTEQILQTPAAKYDRKVAENLQLEKKLNESPKGKMVLCFYKNHGKLDGVMSNKLVEAIIEECLSSDPDKRIGVKEFEEMSQAIIGLFPNESKEVYFNLTKKTNKNNKIQKIGGGKLFRKYYNMRNLLKKNQVLLGNSGASSSRTKSSINITTLDITEAITWLHNCIEPWQEVRERWKITQEHRLNALKQESGTNMFNKFPALKHRLGYTLLEMDFQSLFPEKDMMLYAQWPEFSRKIWNYAKSAIKKDKCNFLMSILEDLDLEDISEDGRNTRLLFLLAYVLKPVTVKKKNSGYWKPTKLEMTEGFIIHVKSTADLKPKIEERKRKLLAFGLTLQPTPIIVGDNLDEITSVYVQVDDHLYEASTPLQGVDMCFKIIHAQHFLYARESEQVWYLIQQGLYKIFTEWDKKFTSVSTMLSTLASLE